MMNILITGGSGFVGSHVARELIRKGHCLYILYRPLSDLNRLNDIKERCTLISLNDLCLQDIFRQYSIDVVIHCATCYSRGNDIDQLEASLNSNVVFPATLMKYARDAGCMVFVNTCTLFVKYQKSGLCDMTTHMSQYILSKKQFRQWGEYLASDGKISFVTMELEHVYGLDDGEDRFIPRILQAINKGESHYSLSAGTQIRDFVAVEDVAKAYALVIDRIEQGNISGIRYFEVGTGIPRTLKHFVKLIHRARKSDMELGWGEYNSLQEELSVSIADFSELKSAGWFPQFYSDENIIDYFTVKA